MDSEEDKGHDCKFQDSDSEHENSFLSISQKATMSPVKILEIINQATRRSK